MKEELTKHSLPKGWVWTTIEQLGVVISGGTPSTKESRYWNGNISWISPADLSGYGEKYISKGKKSITQEGLDESSAKLLPEGSIIFSSRAPIGYVAIAKNELATNQGFKNLIPAKSLNKDYIYYYLKSAKQLAESFASGTTFLELSGTKFAKLPVPLPPHNEQDRIATKLEELFSELDHSIENLKLAQNQLKVYRQAILKNAFEGKLTKEWRRENNPEQAEQLLTRIEKEQNKLYAQELELWQQSMQGWEAEPGRAKRPRKPAKPTRYSSIDYGKINFLFDLPKSSAWIKLGQITQNTDYGSSAKSHRTGKIPVLRMGNIKNGKIDWSDLVYTSSDEEIEKYKLKKNDILFNRTNSPELVGKTAIYKGERPAVFAGYLIRVNQIPSLCNADYLNYYLNSQTAKRYSSLVKTDAVNQSNINGEKLRNYPFPLFPIKEQQEIVEELDRQFSLAENLEKSILYISSQIEYLRKSIF